MPNSIVHCGEMSQPRKSKLSKKHRGLRKDTHLLSKPGRMLCDKNHLNNIIFTRVLNVRGTRTPNIQHIIYILLLSLSICRWATQRTHKLTGMAGDGRTHSNGNSVFLVEMPKMLCT